MRLAAYEFFAALHRTERLLPDDDDRLRDALERNARVIDDAANSIAPTRSPPSSPKPSIIETAMSQSHLAG